MSEWPFDQGPNVAAVTTRQVIEEGLPILTVVHYADDHSWAFMCGTSNATEDGRVIGMGEALKLDPTLATIADLPPAGARTGAQSASHGPKNRIPMRDQQGRLKEMGGGSKDG